jgi:formate hydrogenlyase transcriptional activator
MQKAIEHIPDDVMTALVRYDWPGNIRELQNFIERFVILTRGAELRAPIAELTNQETPNWVLPTLADAERAHIIATLRRTDWVVGGPHGGAAKLGLKRTTLIAKMRNLGISKETAKPGTGPSNAGSSARQFRGACIRIRNWWARWQSLSSNKPQLISRKPVRPALATGAYARRGFGAAVRLSVKH